MLLWAGLILILAGVAALAVDRRVAHYFYDHLSQAAHRRLNRITHSAKAGHWLGISVVALAIAALGRHLGDAGASMTLLFQCSLAFIVALLSGSAVLHVIKLVLGRRRPRDDMEMGLYGFIPFAFNLNYNSFPSGHALTITCVAVIATCVWPMLWPLWLAIAAFLSAVRALLTAHFLSDVLIGMGIGLIAARSVVLLLFPALAPTWF